MDCFRCDGKGKFRNEFGLMERCESCQGKDMTFQKTDEWYGLEKIKERLCSGLQYD